MSSQGYVLERRFEQYFLSSTRGPIFSNKAVGTAYFVFIKFLNKTTKIENMQLSNLARLKQSGTHRLTF